MPNAGANQLKPDRLAQIHISPPIVPTTQRRASVELTFKLPKHLRPDLERLKPNARPDRNDNFVGNLTSSPRRGEGRGEGRIVRRRSA